MKKWILVFLGLSFSLKAQNYLIGYQWGMGSDVTEDSASVHHRYDLNQFMVGLYVENDTLLVFRLGDLQRAGDLKEFQPDYTSYALTVDYLFEETMYTAGLYAGPAWLDGKGYWRDHGAVEESFLGAVGGVEGFFKLTQRLQLMLDLHTWYLPTDQGKRFLVGMSGGISVHF